MATKQKTEKPQTPPIRGKNGGAREGAGRKAFEPTEQERRQVEALSGYGLPVAQIAALIRDGIHVQTLTAYFEKEILLGKAKANAGAAKSIYQKVMSGDPGMMRYWAATQLGWRETQRLEHTSPDGSMTPRPALDASKLSDAALAEILAANKHATD